MHILPIYSTDIKKTKNQNVSMKGLDPASIIIYKIIRMGASAVSDMTRTSKKMELLNRIENDTIGMSYYNINLETCVRSIQALTKLPDSFMNGRVDEMRIKFTKLLSKIPDSSAVLIHTKKDFINSLFNNGHEISQTFVEQFEQLNDSYYGSFKQEVMDKCFFSPHFNSIRKNRTIDTHEYLFEQGSATNNRGFLNVPHGFSQLMYIAGSAKERNEIGRAFCNLELLSTMDKNLYGSYYCSRSSVIHRSKEQMKIYKAKYERQDLYNKYIEPLLSL